MPHPPRREKRGLNFKNFTQQLYKYWINQIPNSSSICPFNNHINNIKTVIKINLYYLIKYKNKTKYLGAVEIRYTTTIDITQKSKPNEGWVDQIVMWNIFFLENLFFYTVLWHNVVIGYISPPPTKNFITISSIYAITAKNIRVKPL